jgi:hypothetical protein
LMMTSDCRIILQKKKKRERGKEECERYIL